MLPFVNIVHINELKSDIDLSFISIIQEIKIYITFLSTVFYLWFCVIEREISRKLVFKNYKQEACILTI